MNELYGIKWCDLAVGLAKRVCRSTRLQPVRTRDLFKVNLNTTRLC
jgi:hypothetical protein